MAAAFSYVWEQWLVIAIGLIFGAYNSQGWFFILSELRADIATNESSLKESPLHHLVRHIVPEAPSVTVAVTFVTITPDTINLGTVSIPDPPTHHSTFVDDNLIGEVRLYICTSI